MHSVAPFRKEIIIEIKIGPKGLSYCVYWRAAAAIVSPGNKIFVEALLLLHYMYYLLQALLTGEWQTACNLVVRSRPYRSTTKVVCL